MSFKNHCCIALLLFFISTEIGFSQSLIYSGLNTNPQVYKNGYFYKNGIHYLVWANGATNATPSVGTYDAKIKLSTSTDGSNWATQDILTTTIGSQHHIITIDSSNKIHIAYIEGTEGGTFGLQVGKLVYASNVNGTWTKHNTDLGAGNGFIYNWSVPYSFIWGNDGKLRLYYTTSGWYAYGGPLYMKVLNAGTWSNPITISNTNDGGADSQNNIWCFSKKVNGKINLYLSEGWKCTGVGCTAQYYNKIKIFAENPDLTYSKIDSIVDKRWYYEKNNQILTVDADGRTIKLNNNVFDVLPANEIISQNCWLDDTTENMIVYTSTGCRLYDVATQKLKLNSAIGIIPANGFQIFADYSVNPKKIYTSIPSCSQLDSLQLITLYNSTDGPNWTNKWDLSKPMSTWYGITLNGQGCVECIDMDGFLDCTTLSIAATIGNNLKGQLPNLKLNSLTKLIISYNSISGNFPNLEINTLETIAASSNKFNGNVPNFNLPNLKDLVLIKNQFNGNIPNFNLPKLEYLFLWGNLLNGNIPNFDKLPNLNTLQLQQNQLTGVIPNFNFPKIDRLWLYNNQLSGCFSDSLKKLCGKDIRSYGNPKLPWQGNFSKFCAGEPQIGAPCNDENPNTYFDIIQNDCSCKGEKFNKILNNTTCNAFCFPKNGKLSATTNLSGFSLEKLAYCFFKEDNPAWFTIRPAYDSLILTLKADKCEGSQNGNGLTFTLIEAANCNDSSAMGIFCSSLAKEKIVTLKTQNLKPGKLYYMNVDGLNDEFCKFTITIDSNLILHKVSKSAITGKTVICKDLVDNYSIQSNLEPEAWQWKITPSTAGVILGNATTKTVKIKWLQEVSNIKITARPIFTKCSPAIIDTSFLNIELFKPTVSISDTLICKGNAVTVTAKNGDTYTWNSGESTAIITKTINNNTSFVVTVTKGTCSKSISTNVSLKAAIINKTTKAFCQNSTFSWQGKILTAAGIYYDTLTTSAGCDSILQLTLNVENPSLLAKANAGNDQSLCSTSTTLSATLPNGLIGQWTTLDAATLNNPSSPKSNVSNLKKGTNHLVWSLSSAVCSNYSSDTVSVEVKDGKTPNAYDDAAYIIGKDTAFVSLLANDKDYNIGKYLLKLSKTPNIGGKWNLEQNKGILSYLPPSVLKDEVVFYYTLCNSDCPDLCDTAKVILKQRAIFDGESVITPNDDGFNDELIVDNINDFPKNEIFIYNRWGNVVFHQKPYNNDWRGVNTKGQQLAQGSYYYVLFLDIGEGEIRTGDILLVR